MAKKPSPQLIRIVKQVLLLALPLLIKAFKNRNTDSSVSARVVDRTATLPTDTPDTKPTKAKRRKSTTPRSDRSSREKVSRPKARHKPSPIAELHRKKRSDVIVTDTGIIVKVLPDDNEGSRHQRFLVEVDHTDVTIKIAHNIDLAPRVPAREGDRLTFRGEYEYNDLGGAFHWTHHDPKKWREGGWIDHEGQRYE